MLYTDQAVADRKSTKILQIVFAQQLDQGPQRTFVGTPPQLVSGTWKIIERVPEESPKKMGIATKL